MDERRTKRQMNTKSKKLQTIFANEMDKGQMDTTMRSTRDDFVREIVLFKGNTKLKKVRTKDGELIGWTVKCNNAQETRFDAAHEKEATAFYWLQIDTKSAQSGAEHFNFQQQQASTTSLCTSTGRASAATTGRRQSEAPMGPPASLAGSSHAYNIYDDMNLQTPAAPLSPRLRPAASSLDDVHQLTGKDTSSSRPGQLTRPPQPTTCPQQQMPHPTGRLLAAAAANRSKASACSPAPASTAKAVVSNRAQRRGPVVGHDLGVSFSGCNVCLRAGSPGLMQGTVLPLGAQVDAGGYGCIYAVKDRHDLLVKVFVSPKGSLDNDLARKEMLVLKLLDDFKVPGVLHICGAGDLQVGTCQSKPVVALLKSHEVLAMVMPRMKMSLERRLEEGALSAQQVIEFAKAGLRIMDRLHYGQPGVNIVHRDIKPANMLLDAKDNIIFADFGAADLFNALNASGSNKSSTAADRTTMVGTKAYMGGELLEAVFTGATEAETYDAITADYRAFGMSLVHMLLGPADTYLKFKKECTSHVPSAAQHTQQVLTAVQHGYGPFGIINGRNEYKPVLGVLHTLLAANSTRRVDYQALLRSLEKSCKRYHL